MATIKDIAQKAGVSVSTASRALNHNPRISEKTRQQIATIAKEMGYQPNYNAQNLTRGESNMVGIIFPVTSDTAPANPFHIDLLRGISMALKPIHYEMVVDTGSFKWLVQSTTAVPAGSRTGLLIAPDAIHIMKKGGAV